VKNEKEEGRLESQKQGNKTKRDGVKEGVSRKQKDE